MTLVMSATRRYTLVLPSPLARQEHRLAAAHEGRHGLQIMFIEQAATRLAGGFIQPIDDESLRAAIQSVLPATPMGELEDIKLLPGMIDAAADTLRKVWRAGIDLGSYAGKHPRLDAIARLEAAVLEQLPPGMTRPVDIVNAAIDRVAHAPAVLGSMEISGLSELSPCWRPLLKALTAHIPVQWTAGPREVPAWLEDVQVSRTPAESPEVSVVSVATAYHEAIEAMRWVRALLASGVAPSEIAIAAASPAGYDDYFLALRAEAGIDLHFAHGIRAVTTRDGQAAAALADIVVRGLSQSRIRRLAALCRDSTPFKTLPKNWLRVLPANAPLSKPDAWERLLTGLKPDDWPDKADHTPELRTAIELLAKGPAAALEIGEAFLKGIALNIWRKALRTGPAASMDATLETLKQKDESESCVSVIWMPASTLTASPRRFVRLIGLNSSHWPRGITEDRLIPNHIIPTIELNPLPVSLADRRGFKTILDTTSDEVVISYARRDSEGRLLGQSPLLAEYGEGSYLGRNAVPLHAFSETDRLMARPQEFDADPQAVSARTCWIDWQHREITPHDGLIRDNHSLILEILERTQSASSLRRLLRNPLSYVWAYAFKWREPQSSADPLVLEPLDFGDLVHTVLDHALRDIEGSGGLASADIATIRSAVERATEFVAADWEDTRPVPPSVIWKRTLEDVRILAVRAFVYDNFLPDTRSYSEVPFGGLKPKSEAEISEMPWNHLAPVTIPKTDFNIIGYIDRLDISGDGKSALVRDYKTGRPPSADIQLDGGRELQRCLYAFAARELLGEEVDISASLLYLRKPVDFRLHSPKGTLDEISTYLKAAGINLAKGEALPGPDTGGKYDDFDFALPANAGAAYCKRKLPVATERLGKAALVWDEK